VRPCYLLNELKKEILKISVFEAKCKENLKNIKLTEKGISEIKTKLKQFDANAIKSDKSNRLVITKKSEHVKNTESILLDDICYEKLTFSKCNSIEKQANILISNIGKKLQISTRDREKLLSIGSEPASFHCLVKDHKIKTNDSFPLRPIASVINTPVEKLDWVISKILNNCTQFIPSHLKSAVDLIDKLQKFKSSDVFSSRNNQNFLSLDVVNLYPSIPIELGINCVINFIKEYSDKLDTLGLNIDDIEMSLRFICFNYEIICNNTVVKQIKGVPMGAHFSCPFAIITLHYIETLALKAVRKIFDIPVYFRYIDDIILGPLECSPNVHNKILNMFNSIDENIQFTIEAPPNNLFLSFLDLEIRFNQCHCLDFKWYSKNIHSDICLNYYSNHPFYMKKNFFINCYKTVRSHCSKEIYFKQCWEKMTNRLLQNGYTHSLIQKILACYLKNSSNKIQPKNSQTHQINLKLPFINESHLKKMKILINRSGFNFRIISTPGQNLINVLQNKNRSSIKDGCDCITCHFVKPKYTCNTKNVVYKIVCLICNDIYIGKTSRNIGIRFNEHCRSINKKDHRNPLVEHYLNNHIDSQFTCSSISLKILAKQLNPLQTSICEAQYISKLLPQINRKFERSYI
jgi:hypothetical protein